MFLHQVKLLSNRAEMALDNGFAAKRAIAGWLSCDLQEKVTGFTKEVSDLVGVLGSQAKVGLVQGRPLCGLAQVSI